MLVRSIQRQPALLLLLVLCAFLYWQLNTAPSSNVRSTKHTPSSKTANPSVPAAPSTSFSTPVKSKKPRIALVTFVTDQRSYIHIALKSKDHYARRHGYDFIVDYEAHTERGVTYWKFNMMERLIKSGKYDWIWWLDFDTLITNTDIVLDDIINETLANATNAEEIDYLITHDCNKLNTGSFIVRGHQRSIEFLHDIYKISDADEAAGDRKSEQDSMTKLMEQDPKSAARTIRVPQWKLNAFPEEIVCYDDYGKRWEPGTFVVHFAGAWAHVKGQDPTGKLMRKYEDYIKWGNWKDFY